MNARTRIRLAVMWNANLNCIPKDKASGTGACFMMCIRRRRRCSASWPPQIFAHRQYFMVAACRLPLAASSASWQDDRAQLPLPPPALRSERLASCLSLCLSSVCLSVVVVVVVYLWSCRHVLWLVLSCPALSCPALSWTVSGRWIYGKITCWEFMKTATP